jgi:DNA-binding MarR family transcriptional regulator
VTLGPGTLYAVLTRLEERGLIEGLPAVRRRRPYRLTAAGAAALSAQARRMRKTRDAEPGSPSGRARVTGDPRLVRALVACCPTGWRRQYGDEYAQLLCDLRAHRRPALIVDSLYGAVRAHGGVLMNHNAPMTAAAP